VCFDGPLTKVDRLFRTWLDAAISSVLTPEFRARMSGYNFGPQLCDVRPFTFTDVYGFGLSEEVFEFGQVYCFDRPGGRGFATPTLATPEGPLSPYDSDDDME
jgi:hypothetical protein